MPRVTLPIARAKELEGMALGPTEWRDVTQEAIERFAEATGDRQWIHLDHARADQVLHLQANAELAATVVPLPAVAPRALIVAPLASTAEVLMVPVASALTRRWWVR